jgi:hypothetical protein
MGVLRESVWEINFPHYGIRFCSMARAEKNPDTEVSGLWQLP